MKWRERWAEKGLRPVEVHKYGYREIGPNGRAGAVVVQKVRFALHSLETGEVVGKTFLVQHKGQAGKFQPGIGPHNDVMYQEPVLSAALSRGVDVLWVEGEKDADSALAAWNIPATSHYQGGAGAILQQAAKLAYAITSGSNIGLVMDRDRVGVQVAWHHARLLRKVGVPYQQIVFLAVRPRDLHADLSDHIAAGYGPDDLLEVSVPKVAARIEKYGPLRPGGGSGRWGSGGSR